MADSGDRTDPTRGVSRRRVLAATGAGAAAGLAGCSDLRNQRFEATPVGLEAGDQWTYRLAEAAREEWSVDREGPGGTSATVVNRAAVYDRSKAWETMDPGTDRRALDTLLGAFVDRVNAEGIGEGGLAVPLAGDAAAPSAAFLETEPSVDPGLTSVVAPSGTVVGDGDSVAVRAGDGGAPLVLAGPGALDADRATLAEGTAFLADLGDVFPAADWRPDGDSGPSERWFPGTDGPAFEGASEVLVATGDRSAEAVFGPGGEHVERRRVEPGDDVDLAGTPVVAADALAGSPLDRLDLRNSTPLPLQGGTFRLATLATPTGQVAGRNLNPVVEMGTEQLLQGDAARRLLRAAGVTDADEVGWVTGPSLVAGGERTCEVLGAEAPLRTYVGTVGGADHAWGVAVHVARTTVDDHVVVAGVQLWPAVDSEPLIAPGDDDDDDDDSGSAESGFEFVLEVGPVVSAGPGGWAPCESPRDYVVDQRLTETVENFGSPVVMDGSTALVGSGNAKTTPYPPPVYVYEERRGTWQRTGTLASNDPKPGDGFGVAAALDDGTAMVGADDNDSLEKEAGAVYVFEFDGSSWTETQKLTGRKDDQWGQDPTRFGQALALDGSTALVAAPGADLRSGGPTNEDVGAVYAFEYDGTSWTETQRLTGSQTTHGRGIEFGRSVAMDGNTAVVGAPDHARSYGGWEKPPNTGAAYVFEYDGSNWTETQRLTASDADEGDWFGMTVAVSGDTLVVGATADDAVAKNAGAAYVFERTGGTWTERAKLTASDLGSSHYFPYSVTVDRGTVVASTVSVDNRKGAAYVFESTGSGWSETRKLTACNRQEKDYFGDGLALDSGTLIAGAIRDDTSQGPVGGRAYVFECPSGNPTRIDPTGCGVGSAPSVHRRGRRSGLAGLVDAGLSGLLGGWTADGD